MPWLASLALLLLAILAGVAIGETAIEPGVVMRVLANKMWAAGYVLDPIDEGIVWNYRLTRAPKPSRAINTAPVEAPAEMPSR